MNTRSLHLLGARAAAQAIAAGDLRSQALVEALLARIDERDPVVQAWSHVDRDGVLRQARDADANPASGVLHGIPVGWKDVIDCAGLPTGCGSPIHRDRIAAQDAGPVAMSRRAGALVLGKTVTAEFAASQPGPTTHPMNPAHTPGGSSSGSAAAVADGMVPVAVGTQTGGSVIRPASFCGIVGFKPSHGMINRFGVKQLADSFDTVGTFARSVEDTAWLMCALTCRADFTPAGAIAPLSVALCRGADWSEVEPAMLAAIEQAMSQLAAAGVRVRTMDLPPSFEGMTEAHKHIEYFELARALQPEYQTARDRLSAPLVARIETGLALPPQAYESALSLRQDCSRQMRDLMDGVDLLLTPAAPGEAPEGLLSTGKATFNRLWTALGLPALTLPHSSGPKRLPLGLQFIAGARRDAALLSHAAWLESLFRSHH
jgi:Asp-tRNA(Asn)/Glu-tRNA(Gln) amidotransferase A subunit family amidase